MPIYSFTGLNGAGKTLYMLQWVQKQFPGRKIYYSGIRDLTLPWELFGGEGPNPEKPWETDPAKWYELPNGSVIVIDEAQRLFRSRQTGAQVPEYVSRLETHRHHGFDIVIVTPHPMLLDNALRRLIAVHFHLVRKMGLQWATVHEWSGVKEQITPGALESAVKREFKYPKEGFALYKSAEVHTVKRRVPFRMWFLLASPLVLGGLVWLAYRTVQPYIDGTKKPVADALSKNGGAAGAPARPGAGGPVLPPGVAAPKPALSRDDYVKQFAPRIVGLVHTAPVYDEVTKIARAPYPAGCVVGHDKACKCYTQDATWLPVPEDLCRHIVANGYFVAWQQASVAAPAAIPLPGGVPGGSVAPAGTPQPVGVPALSVPAGPQGGTGQDFRKSSVLNKGMGAAEDLPPRSSPSAPTTASSPSYSSSPSAGQPATAPAPLPTR